MALEKINRYREIFTILAKYGLAGWIGRLDLDFARDIFDQQVGEKLTRFSTAQRLRMAIAELGPTFIKLGQILSTRPDLVSNDIAEELKSLQANTPSDPPEEVLKVIDGEFQQPASELFAVFDDKALASASIGQVHAARLLSGEEVIVKVQHVGIEEKINLDLEILLDLAQLVEQYVEESRNYRPSQTCEEFKRLLLRELDFMREKRNIEHFSANFANDKNIRIPRVFSQYCTSRVLTMEKLQGTSLADKNALREQGYDLQHLAVVGANMFLRMIFEHGFYHADPHPGNILAMADNQIGLIDCGMIGRLDDELREEIEDLLLSIIQNDGRKLTRIIMRLGSIPRNLDRIALQTDVIEFVDYYSSMPLNKLDLSKAMDEMTAIIRRHKIILPSGISLLIKVLVMLEGTSHALAPDIGLISIIKPYQNKMRARRLSPARYKKMFERFYSDWENVLQVVPTGIVDIVQKLQEGSLHIKFEHERLEEGVHQLVFALIISSLFLGSSLLLAFHSKPTIVGVSALGLIGYVISLVLGLKLLWQLYRSKKFRR